jgi:heparan-alpha-glucosaminide N-acetyltransferase
VLLGASTAYGLIAFLYLLIHVTRVWSGAPFRQIGCNSLLLYCVFRTMRHYFPFSMAPSSMPITHESLMASNLVCVSSIMLLALYLYSIELFIVL